MFLPIMRGTLNLPAARDPEVLERLDPSGTLNMCLRYQQHLALCSNSIASDQNQVISKMREVGENLGFFTISLSIYNFYIEL